MDGLAHWLPSLIAALILALTAVILRVFLKY
jgi:hypothetical protein